MRDSDIGVEDRLFLVDASGSMNHKVRGTKARRFDIVREGLKTFCFERWPVSYYDRPLRISIVAFRLLGTPGETVYEVIVPLYPTPPTLELYRLDDLGPKGGSWFVDGLEYAYMTVSESLRKVKRIDFISDGTPEGPSATPVAEKIRSAGIVLNSLEISDVSTKIMQDIAATGGGSYHLVKTVEEFQAAIS
ncbi:MAG: VWA domain-containing protein [Thaumarchaeota archaeon]|nr:VWA domain-containing protein [Nitrososphaerota archaeon]MBI3022414.1 VWA domain-containing protein [Nitrososphaerota archaeon]MBI3116725.1 VWA domain-containing protein [Nitrososphaerota archaeon]MCS4539125.1 VWA domain-containing protein [Nitrososphaerota archaeon]